MYSLQGFSKVFSERIKEVRKSRNLTQTEFADLIGLVQSKVSDWESLGKESKKPKIYPKIDELFDVAEKLKLSPAWLMGFLDEKDTKPNEKDTDEATAQRHIEFLAEVSEGKSDYFLLKYTNVAHEDEDGVVFPVSSSPQYIFLIKNPLLISFIKDYRKRLEVINSMTTHANELNVLEELGLDIENLKRDIINKYIKMAEEHGEETSEEGGVE